MASDPIARSKAHAPRPHPVEPARKPVPEPAEAARALDTVEAERPSLQALREGVRTSDTTALAPESEPYVPEPFRPAYRLLCRAGLTPQQAAGIAFGGVDAEEAQGLLTQLLSAPPSLASFGPRSVAIAILSRAAQSGLLAGELRASVEKFRSLLIVRPDGVLAHALSGDSVERAGPLKRDGERWKAGSLEVAALYAPIDGVLYPLGDRLEADRSRGPVFELSLDRMLGGRVLDGAEDAVRALSIALGRAIEDPPRTAELAQAFGQIGVAIAAAPEAMDRFINLPLGDQVQAASELMFTLLLAQSAAGAAGGLIDAGGSASGMMVEVNASIGRFALSLDVPAAAVGMAGVGLIPIAALGPEQLLARALEPPKSGPSSSLPELSEKTKGSIKRLTKAVGKDTAASKAKEIQRLAAEAPKLIERLDAMLARKDLSQLLRSRLLSARNALLDHLKQEDLVGALRDAVAMPVREPGTGYIWSHADEVKEGIQALSKARDAVGAAFRDSLGRQPAAVEWSALGDDLGDFARRAKAVLKVEL